MNSGVEVYCYRIEIHNQPVSDVSTLGVAVCVSSKQSSFDQQYKGNRAMPTIKK